MIKIENVQNLKDFKIRKDLKRIRKDFIRFKQF